MSAELLKENDEMTANDQVASAFFREAMPKLEYLWARWQDEREYEDIKDYMLPLKPIAEKHDVELIRMTKRPFGIVFNVKGTVYQTSTTSMRHSLKQL